MTTKISNKTDEAIFNDIIKFEGKTYTNNPADKGGPTKFGITIPAWQTFSGKKTTAKTIQGLTIDNARVFYILVHIRPFDMLVDPLRLLVIDLGILRGVHTSVRMLQEIVGAQVDGWIGKETLGKIALFDNRALTTLLIGARLHHIEDVIKADASQKIFRAGWRKRTLAFL